MPGIELEGRVREDLIPTVRLFVTDFENEYSSEHDFIVDSGCSAHLILPASLMGAWRGTIMSQKVQTSSAEEIVMEFRTGYLHLGGSPRYCEVMFGGHNACLGMGLLEGCRIQFDVLNGGLVQITES